MLKTKIPTWPTTPNQFLNPDSAPISKEAGTVNHKNPKTLILDPEPELPKAQVTSRAFLALVVHSPGLQSPQRDARSLGIGPSVKRVLACGCLGVRL